MSIPILKTPEYNTILPSGREVVYRPFLVKEEKVMLTIKESKNVKDILRVMKSVVSGCLLSGAKVDELTYNDTEHLFILMRCRSIGEEVEITHKCKECGKESPVSVDISNVGLSKPMPESDIVMLNDEVGGRARDDRRQHVRHLDDGERRHRLQLAALYPPDARGAHDAQVVATALRREPALR